MEKSVKASVFGSPLTTLLMMAALFTVVGIGTLLGKPLIVPPLIATASYVFGAPGIPGTQPRSVLAGHFIAALVGFVVLLVLPSLWGVVVAAGVTALLMNALELFHIPAIATAALVVMQQPVHRVSFTVSLLLGAALICLSGAFLARVTKKLHYPLYW